MFQGKGSLGHNGSFWLHRVSYELNLSKNIELGLDGEYVPEIPEGCTRICGQSEKVRVYARWLEDFKLMDISLRIVPRKYWMINFFDHEQPDQITSITTTKSLL